MDNKWLKVILHASAFFAPVLVPAIMFILAAFLDGSEQLKKLSIQALLFQFVMWLLLVIAGVLSYILIGIPFLIIFGLMTIIVPIVGIVRALQDKDWEYPIVKRFF